MGRLFWKVFIATWLVQALAVLAISTGVWFKDRNAARRDAQVGFGPPAAFAVDAAAETLRFGGMPALRALLQHHEGAAVYAIDSQGHDLLGRATRPAVIQQLRQLHDADPGAHALQVVDAQGESWLLFAARQERGPGESGRGPLHGHRPPHRNYFPMMPMVLAMLGSLLSSALLAWHFAKPIRRLRQAFDAVAAGKLDTRIGGKAKGGGDELTDLGHDFDRMAQRLESVLEAQRRLMHDVSHEMRSPLARLQAAIGLARQRPERVHASLERIERESVRMDGMIGEVLALARLDAGGTGAARDEVGVEDLVAEVVDDASYEAQAAGKSVSFDAPGASCVQASTELLHSAVENVVRNAIKHTADGTGVHVSVAADESKRLVAITVCDQGPGVPEDELELIFRPFQRGSDGGKLPGHGLGLAIADRVVRNHGGTISARNRDAGGLCVEIVLPLAP
jgi:two-component system OmpR family sensor kinase